jgi:CheY-like chemotaxis protein
MPQRILAGQSEYPMADAVKDGPHIVRHRGSINFGGMPDAMLLERGRGGSLSEADMPRVLVADDNALGANVIRAFIRKLNIQVDVAANGEEAVTLCEGYRCKYGLVLMDAHMPVMDGNEATRRIREAELHTGVKRQRILLKQVLDDLLPAETRFRYTPPS